MAIIGISADVEPSFEMCLDVVIGYCAKPFSAHWTGLESWQLRQKIINTKMDDICRYFDYARVVRIQERNVGAVFGTD
jgi:hypothetical protein